MVTQALRCHQRSWTWPLVPASTLLTTSTWPAVCPGHRFRCWGPGFCYFQIHQGGWEGPVIAPRWLSTEGEQERASLPREAVPSPPSPFLHDALGQLFPRAQSCCRMCWVRTKRDSCHLSSSRDTNTTRTNSCQDSPERSRFNPKHRVTRAEGSWRPQSTVRKARTCLSTPAQPRPEGRPAGQTDPSRTTKVPTLLPQRRGRVCGGPAAGNCSAHR